MISWHIFTGEYPPTGAGVADYTRLVARALAAAGEDVHIWTANREQLAEDDGVRLHPLSKGFGPGGLLALSAEFAKQPGPRRILLQYVPQAFGLRGTNLPFCAWLASVPDVELWVMFHEVLVRWESPRTWQTALLSSATHLMAAVLAARADRMLVSTPFWNDLIHRVSPNARPTWAPVPSTLPTEVPDGARARVRSSLGLDAATPLLGHFGTYGAFVTSQLEDAVIELVSREPRRQLLLLGRGSDTYARTLAVKAPALAHRIRGTGPLDDADLAAHLAACDVMVQPYKGGVNARRTTAMAGIALGRPVATTEGWLTEDVWRGRRAVELAPENEVAAATERILRDDQHAAAIAAGGRRLYGELFSLEHTVRILRGA